jgi:hypothetical protein
VDDSIHPALPETSAPKLWAMIKGAYPELTREIVEDPGQDGYGIGVLRWNGKLLV